MLISYMRTVILYLLLILVVRVMGKRQIGQMEPTEFVVTMLLANLAAVPMQDNGIPLASGLVPMLTVLGISLILSVLAYQSIRMRRLLCGKPVILVENGTICQRNLARTRIHLDELTEHLREQGILDLTTVKYAILETNGLISTILYPKDAPATAKDAGITVKDAFLPYTLISDGHLLPQNLHLAGYNHHWLRRQLEKRNLQPHQVLLMTVDGAGKIYLARKEENTSS